VYDRQDYSNNKKVLKDVSNLNIATELYVGGVRNDLKKSIPEEVSYNSIWIPWGLKNCVFTDTYFPN